MSWSPSFLLKTESGCKVDPKSLKRWGVAFCIIRFNLEQGRIIKECYPLDERLKRGGEQKSVIILSYCPFSNVFKSSFFFTLVREL
uniref:Uncharacterized protein n=1 Tax=Nelumbo nucifera TaxID=4432 RepID=A0A822YGP3_NELNU|nr:TPA_asm: hypothetical protein HUJ06_010591 [Nelumbo nucifera]